MKRIVGVLLVGLVLLAIVAASANPLLEHDGRWFLVSHRVDQEHGNYTGSETRVGSEPKSLAGKTKQMREGWKTDPRFGGTAILTDSLSIITLHWGTTTEIHVFRGEVKPGKSKVTYVMGTGWTPGDRFRITAKLKKDPPYDGILLPDDTEMERRLKKEGRKKGGMVPIYDMMDLDLVRLKSESGVVRFRFRRIVN